MKYQIILASHGSLAEGVESAVKMIAGKHDNLFAFGLDKWKTPQAIDEQVEKIIKDHKQDGILILCDIIGGSVHNKLVNRCVTNNAIVISGINLGLVLDLVLTPDEYMNEEKIINSFNKATKAIGYYNQSSFTKKEKEEDSLW